MSFIGGGGEPMDAPHTQFDLSLSNFSNFARDNNNDYAITVNFNGGHHGTEDIIKNNFSASRVVENFSKENYNKMIEDYIDLLRNDKIPENGKILIFINSHGAEASGNTHEISLARSAITNLNTGSKKGLVSLDALAKISELAEKKNVKLAIIDASCHSGSSLKLANSKTCVISGSAPNLYSYTDFAEIFASHMIKGRNLEDIFMTARNSADSKGFPMISTPEGLQVQEEIFSSLFPYLFFHDNYRGLELDKIDSYLKKEAATGNFCSRESNFLKLNSVLDMIENFTATQLFFENKIEKTINLDDLRNSIKAYKDIQEDYIKKLSVLNSEQLKKVEPLDLGNGVKSPGYTHEQLLATDWNYLINEKNVDIDKEVSLSRKKSLSETRLVFSKAQEKKEKILTENPDYQKYLDTLVSIKDDVKLSESVASRISNEASKAYNAYYNELKKKRSETKKSATNACKDFIL